MSTVEKGDTFRDQVIDLLEAADIRCIGEVRKNFKKVDIEARIEDRFDGEINLVIEAKDYEGNLPKQQCINFLHEYGSLIRNRNNHKAWLISKNPITPDGRALIEENQNCKCFTFAELQRWTLNLKGYTNEIIAQFEADKIDTYFIEPKMTDGTSLTEFVDKWLDDESSQPLAITGSYGVGKTTFARHLAARLGQISLTDTSARIPILIPLGEVYNEQSIDGLVGKVLASIHRVPGYHFKLFESLNKSGRFVLVFDGFDEMKHGMTMRGFEKNVTEFMSLDKGNARIIILGRDTAFHSEVEFRSIIEGKRKTFGGSQIADTSRRPFRPILLQGFTLEEAKLYITNYFPIAVEEASRRFKKIPDREWIDERKAQLLSGSVDELLDRPVHAQMLCQIATDPELAISYITRYQLYDMFIDHLINREVLKKGRSANFDITNRRNFNSALAWWLWERGGASTTTFSDIPDEICKKSVEKIPHDYDEIALRRELVAGCLVSKGGDTIFFSHRSIQEFLVAEHLLSFNFLIDKRSSHIENSNKFMYAMKTLTPEVVEFIISGVKNKKPDADNLTLWYGLINVLNAGHNLNILALDLFTKISCAAGIGLEPWSSPWAFLIENFARVGRAEFTIANDHLAVAGSLITKAREQDIRLRATCIFYWGRCIRVDTGNASKLTAILLSAMCSPSILADALRTVNNRSSGHGNRFVIEYRRDNLLWLFLRTVTIGQNAGGSSLRLSLDVDQLLGWATLNSGISIPDEIMAGVVKTFRSLAFCTVDELCDAADFIGYRSGEVSTIRRFVSNSEFRERIRPSNIPVAGIRNERAIRE